MKHQDTFHLQAAIVLFRHKPRTTCKANVLLCYVKLNHFWMWLSKWDVHSTFKVSSLTTLITCSCTFSWALTSVWREEFYRSLILLRSSFRWKHLSYNPSYLEDAVKTCLHSRWTLCSLLIHKVKAEKSQLSVNSSIVSDSVKIRDTGLQKPVFSAGIFLVMFFRELNPKMTFTSLHHVQLFWQSVRSLHEKSTTVMKKINILLQLWIIFLTIEQRKKTFPSWYIYHYIFTLFVWETSHFCFPSSGSLLTFSICISRESRS